MAQQLLIPDPRPLDDRLGQAFFREAPKRAGVYVMRDAADRVLYVGKAKNLQQRLRNYRTANPDRMLRRHLRMVREVVRIELQCCSSESAALKRESKLLRSLKPKYNRAGVRPGKTRFITWRQRAEQLELAVVEVPETGWQRFGPLGGSVIHFHPTLIRIVWLALNPARLIAELPHGWTQGRVAETTALVCGGAIKFIMSAVEGFFWGRPEDFIAWLETQLASRQHPFERALIETDLETLKEFARRHRHIEKKQMALL